LEHCQKNLSDWNEIRNEILGSAERKGAVEKAKKRLGIK